MNMQYAFEQLWCSEAIEFWGHNPSEAEYGSSQGEDCTIAPETPDSVDVSEIMKAFNMDCSQPEGVPANLFDLGDAFEVPSAYSDCFSDCLENAVEEQDMQCKPSSKPLIPVAHFFSPHASQNETDEEVHSPRAVASTSSEDENVQTVITKKKISPSARCLKRAELKPEKRVTKKQKTSFTGKKNKQPAPIITDFAAPDLDAQNCCCLSGCSNAVTNRLRFSLRRPNTFKEDFVNRQWNKICQYHYFSDLYQHKKSLNH
ncbi:hypothetical protein AKO1_002018 [Acrasis kona]|uniref:Uncharacterized protein n=1 Tax=Acrasis kona TaxID=1008807 RepID=A0AAW2ZAB5_9EUKA